MIRDLENLEFILIGGYIRSINDCDEHYIPAYQLATFYGLRNYDNFVILADEEIPPNIMSYIEDDVNPFQIILRPRYDGDYSGYLNKAIDKWRNICELN